MRFDSMNLAKGNPGRYAFSINLLLKRQIELFQCQQGLLYRWHDLRMIPRVTKAAGFRNSWDYNGHYEPFCTPRTIAEASKSAAAANCNGLCHS